MTGRERKSPFVDTEDKPLDAACLDGHPLFPMPSVVARSTEGTQVARVEGSMRFCLDGLDMVNPRRTRGTDEGMAYDAAVTIPCKDPLSEPSPCSEIIEPRARRRIVGGLGMGWGTAGVAVHRGFAGRHFGGERIKREDNSRMMGNPVTRSGIYCQALTRLVAGFILCSGGVPVGQAPRQTPRLNGWATIRSRAPRHPCAGRSFFLFHDSFP